MPSRSFRSILPAAVLPALALCAGGAGAATPEAWDAFRKDVETSCLAAAAPFIATPRIVVDPFGSQSFGLAFLSGTGADNAALSVVCIYDKAAKRAEIGGTMALESAVPELRPNVAETAGMDVPPLAGSPPAFDLTAETGASAETDAAAETVPLSERLLAPPGPDTPPGPVAPPSQPAAAAQAPDPAPERLAGRCEAACAATLDGLGEADRDALLALPEQVRRVVGRNPDAALGEGPGQAREAAAAAAASAGGEEAADISAPTDGIVGEGGCVLYYYGFEGEASRTVGRHRCRVSEGENGVLRVEKTSGERLQAELRPLTDDLAAFVGRTFLPDQGERAYDAETPDNAGNDEFGNAVGFAVENEGRLLLISQQQRRFDASEDFFWVLALDAP